MEEYNFLKQILDRITIAKDDNPDVHEACKTYGDQAVEMLSRAEGGDFSGPYAYLSRFLPWLLGKGIITPAELEKAPENALKSISCFVGGVHDFHNQRAVLINAKAKCTGHSEIFAYDSQVLGKDNSFVHLYGKSMFGGSGWVVAFDGSTVDLRGEGIAYCYDSTYAMVKGDAVAFLYDKSTGRSDFGGIIRDKREG